MFFPTTSQTVGDFPNDPTTQSVPTAQSARPGDIPLLYCSLSVSPTFSVSQLREATGHDQRLVEKYESLLHGNREHCQMDVELRGDTLRPETRRLSNSLTTHHQRLILRRPQPYLKYF